ncbi:von Willebrand factor A domain-containing protein 1 [Solea senegalensis]|uniref:von Willebrand factor A domain-containing protein 1 n=1 Tax=Solea senegalensis TaxID=28829 RepID=A0AAV6QSX8_SOLSE|nr:von Willebrand factor A domain-containing protein 1-like [Solea senegalensis]XP_043880968.1 von Willebrand factor A domain-containing protein 1-like [Solea senegalensis]KAG7495180.1 von Willebrand factor A domain-containing protein 1 [Solea senegalensis]
MRTFLLHCVFLWATSRRSSSSSSSAQVSVPAAATVLTCCEGDIVLLLDSSGSLANYEFSRLLRFTAELLRPFSLGRGHVRVSLLQVGTSPKLEFGLNVHNDQESLQKAVRRVQHLQGDTNTVAALRVARQLLTEAEEDVPKVLLWLTDGVQPGDVDGPIKELKARGVSVLIVSTVHGNYQVLQRAVTPPLESHLYAVDIDDVDIITEDLRNAIIKIIRAERLDVVHLTSHSAVLQWRPILRTDSGYYELQYNSMSTTDPESRRTLSGDSSSVELINLQPDTTYTASLRPESNQRLFNTLSVSFLTLPGVLSPAVVVVSDSGPHQIHVSWGPLQPTRVRRYTVEYGAIPSGDVRKVSLDGRVNSTLLTGLKQGSQYLVTVSALHMDGKEVAMSVKACTQDGTEEDVLGLLVEILKSSSVFLMVCVQA